VAAERRAGDTIGMKRLLILFCALGIVLAQESGDHETRMPSGKLQRDEILKADHAQNVKDAAELAKLSAEIQDELEKSDGYILPLKTVKKLEDVEKLAKTIRGRLNKN
jgi:hypothetical protein